MLCHTNLPSEVLPSHMGASLCPIQLPAYGLGKEKENGPSHRAPAYTWETPRSLMESL